MPVATPQQPDFTSQTGATYRGAIDGAVAAAKQVTDQFAPHEQATPNMTVRLEAGTLFLPDRSLVFAAAQSTGTITAPATNPRNDIVVIDATTGNVSVITGAEAASPVDPAITANQIPIARVRLATSTAAIDNSQIDDLRGLFSRAPIAEFTAENASEVTVTSGGVVLAQIDLGSVKVGDRIRFESQAGFSKGATGGTTFFGVGLVSGTAVLEFLNDNQSITLQDETVAGGSWVPLLVCTARVTTGGTCTVGVTGTSLGSDSTVPAGNAQLFVRVGN